MATANNALRVAELDFDTIKSNLIQYLQSQNEFADYDFEGSGMSVLLDILAYNTHMMAFYLNMVGNEMFMDTAQLRQSIISHAKHINYVPHSMKGAEAVVNVKITPEGLEDQVTGTMTLPKYTRFISEPVDGTSYIFSTVNANTTQKSAGSFTFSNVVVRQGEVVTQQFAVNGQRRFNIPSANVDTDTISITVRESASNSAVSVYQEANDITEITSTSPVYFIEENSDADGKYTIEFGDGVLGKRLSNDSIVIVKYLDTHGEFANKSRNFLAAESINGYTANIIVSTVSVAAGGSSKETVEEIRQRAPIAYTVQNRAVTKNDYKTLLLDDYPNIDAVTVWSGDENDPPVYGKIFISMKPKEDYEISLLEKELIKNQIIANRAVLTVTPEIVDPDYTYMLLNITCNYDPNKTTLDETELKQLIRQAVIDYRDSDLKDFDSTFRMSRLQKAIDNAHESIIGSSVRIYLQKRKEITLNQDKIYTMTFNTPIYKGVIDDKFYTYPSITVKDSEGNDQLVYIEDTPKSLTGIDSIVISAPGSGYLDAPEVTISGDGSGATAVAKVVNGRINSIEVTNRGVDYTRATVAITGDTGSGATATVNLQARNGTLRSFYYRTNGEKVVVNENIGSIDYVTGKIIVNSLNPSLVEENDRYTANFLTFNAVPFDDVIGPGRNRILDIDTADSASITIKLIPEGF